MPRFINPVPHFLDDAGDPLIEGLLYVFESGTDTPKATYADVNLTIQNSHPIELTGSGRLPNVWFDGTARVKLTDSDDVQIWDKDPVSAEGSIAAFDEWVPSVIYGVNDIVEGSDGNFYRSFNAGNEGNDPTTTPTEWEQVEFIRVWNTNVTYETGNIVVGSDNNFYKSLTASNQGNDPTSDIVNWGTPFEGVSSVTGNVVDNTDPENPIVTAVETVTGGTGITVTGTATDPIVNADNNGTVTSVTGGVGITNSGTAADPVLDNDFPELSADTSPQLGADLDANSFSINESEGAAVASATTTDIFGGDDGNTLHITGTTTIVDFTDASNFGRWRKIIFDGVLTLTHGSGITLQGGANITTAAGDYAFVYADAVDAFTVLYFKADGTSIVSSGKTVQTAYVEDGEVATGTTVSVIDDTIPQNTEGNEFITLAITPTDAANILFIETTVFVAFNSTNTTFLSALFQDTTADALAAGSSLNGANANGIIGISFTHRMVAGTTSLTTFKIRAGSTSAGTVTFNGFGGARKLAGVMSSSIKITEETP